MRVAVLGLGRMGQAVANRLLETGHELTVWNRSPGKDQDLVRQGAKSAGSIAEAVSGAQLVMTLLTADEAVQQVYEGTDGVLKSAPQDAVLVDMSTISPDTSRRIAGEAAPRSFLDCPILGGPDITQQGQAKFLVAGDEQTVRSLDPLWHDLCSSYVYCGPSGAATTMKLLSNLNLIAGTIMLSETVATAQKSGIPESIVRQVLGESPAVAPGVRVRMDDIVSGDHEGWWTIKLAEKDAGLALDLASKAGLTLTLGKAAEDVLEQTEQAGYGEQDLGAVVEAVRRG